MDPVRGWMRGLLLSMMILVLAGRAAAAPRLHALIIGNNDVFPGDGEGGSPSLIPLRYADDDAAAVAAFIGQVAASVRLLTLMDATTQAIYPDLVSRAQPPTLAAVEEAVALLSAEVARDRARGEQSVVWFFFSGHGRPSPGPGAEGRPPREQGPGLALLDGSLTRELLYEQILARLPASYVHLLVDACHAESIVRPRDSQAQIVNLTPAVVNATLLRTTLARYPNVGAILASSRNARAHEWDTIGHGVFTHELLSALRGGADVNGDRLLEYSEVYAFMSAANQSVTDPRARLAVVARPPARNQRVPLLSLRDFSPAVGAWLTDISGERGTIRVADGLGRRLATLHNAADFTASLLLPAGSTLFLSAGGVEAEMPARTGAVTRFGDLRFEPPRWRSRGELSSALERGLFATAYGRGYYDGFTANVAGLVPVPFGRDAAQDASPARVDESGSASGRRVAVGFGGRGSVARGLGVSYGAQVAFGPAVGHGPVLAVDASTAGNGALREWRASVECGWSWQTASRWLQGYAGPRLAGGWIVQQMAGRPSRTSAVALAGGSLGVLTRITDWLGVFAEVEASAQLMRRDGATKMSPLSSLWLGNTLEW